ncbi:MAG: polyprenyl synthetase family protein [Myxococcales bacterium]|nr:polyprenyl synthetase family protein [Myxococcales bacterium]
MTTNEDFRSRLCHVLVKDRLAHMEIELLTIKSVRALSRHPWKGGKRLRPIMFLLSYLSECAAAGRPTDPLGREIQLAAALELMHEASLVHDDLVDRSEIRRGEPTVQITNGAGRALLMGDYMVFRALKLVLDSATSARDIQLAQGLADTALDIAHGQLQQLEHFLEEKDPNRRMALEPYLEIIGKKTAMFFAGCCEGGAALAGVGQEGRMQHYRFGLELGLVFQMLDDLIDVLGDPAVAAKSLDNNIDEGTMTLPFIHAYQLFPERAPLRRLAEGQTLAAAERAEVLDLVRSRLVVAECRGTIQRAANAAMKAWSNLPTNIFATGLFDVLDYVCGGSWGGVPDLGIDLVRPRRKARASRRLTSHVA